MQAGNEVGKSAVTVQPNQPIASSSSSSNNLNTTSQTKVDLDELIKIWAETWAKENTGKTYEWYATDRNDIWNENRTLKKELKFLNEYSDIPQQFLVCSSVSEEPAKSKVEPLPGEKIQKKSFAVKNEDSAEKTVTASGQFEYAKTETKAFSSTVTLTKGITLGPNVTFPGTPLGISLQAALSKASTNNDSIQHAVTRQDTTTYASDIKVPGNSLATMKAICTEKQERITREYRVKLEGSIYACLKKDCTQPKGSLPKQGEHHKWTHPVYAVFKDLERYSKWNEPNSIISIHDLEIIKAGLSHFTFDDTDHAISFLLEEQGIVTKAEVKVDLAKTIPLSSENLPQIKETLTTLSAQNPPSGEDPAKPHQTDVQTGNVVGRTFYFHALAINVKGGVGVKLLGSEDYAPERIEEFLESINKAQPGDTIYQNSVVVNEEGARALMMPASAKVDPSAHALALAFGNSTLSVQNPAPENIPERKQ